MFGQYSETVGLLQFYVLPCKTLPGYQPILLMHQYPCCSKGTKRIFFSILWMKRKVGCAPLAVFINLYTVKF